MQGKFSCRGTRTFSYDSAQRHPFTDTIRADSRFPVGRKPVEFLENGTGNSVGLGHCAAGISFLISLDLTYMSLFVDVIA